MRVFAIRYWLILALGVYFVSSIFPFAFVGTFVCTGEKPSQAAALLSHELSVNVDRWTDPAWQKQMSAQLPDGLSLGLYKDNQKVFTLGPTPANQTWSDYIQVVIMNGTQQLGVANLYNVSPCGGTIYATLALPSSIGVQILVGLGITLVLTRYLMRPLRAMSEAAHHIADGNLDFHIPPSRVREVAEVARAFDTMGDALRTSVTRQAALEQDRRFFISAIAHDLRTPLFALRGYLEGLEKGLAATPEKAAHYIQVCQEKADVLEHLITGLFAYARLEYLEQSPKRVPMDFARLINKAVDSVRPRAEASHIALQISGIPSPCDVQGDPALLERTLDNLLDNALRYTPPNGWIKVTWDKREGSAPMVRFVVADSGPGIAAHDLPHLFTALYRAEASRSRETGGAGLGLIIARRILQAHGGDLTAANGINGGAEFTGTFMCGAFGAAAEPPVVAEQRS